MSSCASSVTPSQSKKPTVVASTMPSRELSKVELVAELNSRLAKLTDAAASDISRRLPAVTKTNTAERQMSSQAARCSKEAVSGTQSMLKAPAKSGDRDTRVTKQQSSTLTAGSGVSRPSTTPSSLNNKNSSLPRQAQPVSDTRVSYCLISIILLVQQQQPFYVPLSGTTRVSRFQKKHSPTRHPDHHSIFISFFHLPRSIASSLFKLRAWQSFHTTSLHVSPYHTTSSVV